jgi:transcriptional regulator with XRE-family HTH domain
MTKTSRASRPHDLGRHTLCNQLKDIIEARGISAYALAIEARISRPVVARFLSGERDIRGATLDKIAHALGLRLVETARGTQRRPRIMNGVARGRISED